MLKIHVSHVDCQVKFTFKMVHFMKQLLGNSVKISWLTVVFLLLLELIGHVTNWHEQIKIMTPKLKQMKS